MTEQTVNQEDELADDGVWTTTPEGERIPNYEATFPDITEGQVVHGTVVRVDKDEVWSTSGTSRRG